MVAGEKKDGSGAGEKAQEVITAVYKLNLHCRECARALERPLIRTQGIHKVDTDVESGKVIVKGMFDPMKIHERLERKCKRKVELVSPKPKIKDDKASDKKEEKKEEVVRTTVVKVNMHCENCENDLKLHLLKLKGVHTVKTNREAETCTVVGTIEEQKLIEYLRKKVRKHAEIVPQKQEKKVQEKKEEQKKKTEMNVDSKGSKEDSKEKKDESKTNEKVVPYIIHYVYAPQWFSDEDPNSCTVM